MNYKNYNDYELISMVRESDSFSRDIMYEKYQPVLVSICKEYYQKFKNYGYDFEDFLQEANVLFEKALINYSDNKDCLFYTFVNICVRRGLSTFCRNISNSKIKIYYIDISKYDFKEEKVDVNRMVDEYGLECEISRILYNYPLEFSAIFELKLNGFNYIEISNLLDIPCSTVEYRVRKIRKDFHKYYCQKII
jgi:RNA polymerase sigma factor (sigma-70 family)